VVVAVAACGSGGAWDGQGNSFMNIGDRATKGNLTGEPMQAPHSTHSSVQVQDHDREHPDLFVSEHAWEPMSWKAIDKVNGQGLWGQCGLVPPSRQRSEKKVVGFANALVADMHAATHTRGGGDLLDGSERHVGVVRCLTRSSGGFQSATCRQLCQHARDDGNKGSCCERLSARVRVAGRQRDVWCFCPPLPRALTREDGDVGKMARDRNRER
jgi:hypothetical protein